MSARTTLKISPDLSLPPDAATSTIIAYGGKGMGKTNFASVLVEEFDSARIRFSVIDPMGVWWGLRHGADGKGPGIDVLILGGIHGDLPITPESGVLVADLVVDEDANVIIDISRRADGSMWSIGERVRFVTAYAKRMYQRQGEKRRPISQVIDEAARFAPQIVRQGDVAVAECMGAIAVLVEEGRNVGIGVVLMTQRSARLNKDVAELADCMVSFRIIGPNSMRAVLDWLGEHVEKARFKEIGEQLRKLPRGSALVVSPGWLEFEGIVAIRKRTTFDSSATPKSGKQVRASGAGAKPDLSKYRVRLAELVEQQKANDPKQLKAEIARLKKAYDMLEVGAEALRVAKAQLEQRAAGKPAKTIERLAIQDAQLSRIEKAVAAGDALIKRWGDVRARSFKQSENEHKALMTVQAKADMHFQSLGEHLSKVVLAVQSIGEWQHKTPPMRQPAAGPAYRKSNVGSTAWPATPKAPAAQVRKPKVGSVATVLNGVAAAHAARDAAENTSLTGPQKVLLSTLSWWVAMGHDAPSRAQIAGKAGWKARGSNLRNRLSELHTLGLVVYPTEGTVSLTVAGAAAAPDAETSETLHDSIRGALTGPQKTLFEELLNAGQLGRESLADRVTWDPNGSNLRNRLSELATMEIVEYPAKGCVRLQQWVTE